MKTMAKTKTIRTHELLGGKYKVEGCIATGGMGKIYRALQGDLERPVAVKIIDMDQMTSSMEARFNREMKTLTNLQVPNVITIYDYDKFHGHDFYVMPLLQGGTLKQRIEICAHENRQLPSLGEVNQRLQLLAQALQLVHNQAIIHRDIKPSNIMFDVHGQPFIIDFGIAREPDPQFGITSSNVMIGTWPYMCLAQMNAQMPNYTFDLYALAVVFYQVLNGAFPYRSQQAEYYTDYIIDLKNPPEELESWREDLPDSLKSIFKKALSQNPAQQYPDIISFAADFAKEALTLPGENTGFFTFPVPQAEVDRNDLPSTMHTKSVEFESNMPSTRRNRGLVLILSLAVIALIGVILVTQAPPAIIPTPTLENTSITEAATNIVAVIPTAQDTSTTEPTTNQPLVATDVPALSTLTPSPSLSPTPEPTNIPTPTKTACDVLLGGELPGFDQWSASGCVEAFAVDDPQLGALVLVPCLKSDIDCHPILVNKFEITRSQYYEDTGTNANLPATSLSALNAKEWCEGRGGRLLTAEEWRRASGAAYGLAYPWGQEARTDYPAIGSPYDIHSYVADTSWAGLIDMGGNVAEFVQGEQVFGTHYRNLSNDQRYRVDGEPRPLKGEDATVGLRCAKEVS